MAEYKGDNKMELHKLNKGDDIWFKYPDGRGIQTFDEICKELVGE